MFTQQERASFSPIYKTTVSSNAEVEKVFYAAGKITRIRKNWR
jgi:hypothetical protein